MDLRGTGVWSSQLARGDLAQATEAAAELEELGFTAIWMPGGFRRSSSGDIFDRAGAVLDATRRVQVATGIVSVWTHTPEEAASGRAALTARHPGRFLLGIGVSHRPLVDSQAAPGTYRRPLATIDGYLDALDVAQVPVPGHERCLAALGPAMLELAGRRTLGTHPYLVTSDHTRYARERLGAAPLVAPEQTVVVETDPARARAIGRRFLATYLGLPNYVDNLRRFGFGDDDFADGGNDRLVDAVVAWGTPDAIAARVAEHRDAGADHVCVQVVTDDPRAVPCNEWRELAPALNL